MRRKGTVEYWIVNVVRIYGNHYESIASSKTLEGAKRRFQEERCDVKDFRIVKVEWL